MEPSNSDASTDNADSDIETLDISSQSSQELYPIEENEYENSFKYKDPLLFTGIMRDVLLNNNEEVLRKISLGKSVRVVDNNGNSLLHLAVEATRNDMSMIDLLLRQEEIDINAVNFLTATPLIDSISQKKSSVAIHLIKAGANVNFPLGCTPLHQCLKNGSPEICEALIQAGADLNAPDLDGDTPLHLAVYYCQFEMMCMLLLYGAEMRRNAMLRPFAFSISMKRFTYADVLLDYETEFDSQTLESAISNLYPNLHTLILKIDMEERNFCFAPKFISYHILLVNIDIFDFIWKHFQVEFDFPDFFFSIFYSQCWNDSDFERIIDILKTSRPELMMKLVDWSAEKPFLYPLIMILTSRNANADVYEICTIFLSNGIVVWDIDLDLVYDKFGFCELFRLLLHMDIIPSVMPKVSVIPYLYYSVDDTMCFRDRVLKFVNFLTIEKPYYFCTSAPIPYELKSFLTFPGIEGDEVPKLTELARNSLRDHLCVKNKIKSSSQFYTLLKILPFPYYIKKIISLETPIYHSEDLNAHIVHCRKKRLGYYEYIFHGFGV